MPDWSDAAGREWPCTLTVQSMRKIKESLKIDLLNSVTSIQKLVDEPLLVADIVWKLAEHEARKLGINQEQFFEALDGPALDRARAAFYEAWEDFFQKSPSQQELIRRAPMLMEEAAGMGLQELARTIPAAAQPGN